MWAGGGWGSSTTRRTRGARPLPPSTGAARGRGVGGGRRGLVDDQADARSASVTAIDRAVAGAAVRVVQSDAGSVQCRVLLSTSVGATAADLTTVRSEEHTS